MEQKSSRTIKNITEQSEAVEKQERETITNLVNLLNNCDRDSDQWKIIRCLGTIAPKNTQAINILIEILVSGKVLSRYLVAETLSKIAVGNETVITSLVEIIYRSKDTVSLNCTTTILSNIAKDRPHAVRALIYLLKNNTNLAQKLILVQKLNKIAEGHPQVIIAWLDIVVNGENYAIRRSAIKNLSQVTVGNQNVIAELKKIVHKKGRNRTIIEGKKLAKIGLKQIDRSNQTQLMTNKLSHLLQPLRAKLALCQKAIAKRSAGAIAITFLQFLNFITFIIFNPLHSLRSKKHSLAKSDRAIK